jgi:hypothetical protein
MPSKTPVSKDVDYAKLSNKYEFTGANIMNTISRYYHGVL